MATRGTPPARTFGEERRFGAASAERGRGFSPTHASFTRDPRGHPYFVHGRRFEPLRAERYAWPHGYNYHRYAVGYRLPPTFIVQQYYITDYETYGVDSPPPDFQWIRYGPDLLLIDVNSGQVSNAVYGVFEDDGSQEASADPGTADAPQN
jgi:Ni/Co efflux regulator RcnB